MKKFVSLLLIAVLALSLAVPAFAAEEPEEFAAPAAAEPETEELAEPEIPDAAADEPETAPPAEDAENPAGGGFQY